MNTLQELQDQLDKTGRKLSGLGIALMILCFSMVLVSGFGALAIHTQSRVIETLEARIRARESIAQYPLLRGDDPRDLTSYAIPAPGQALVVHMGHNTTVTTPFLWTANVGDAMVYLIDIRAYPKLQLKHSTDESSWEWKYDISKNRGRYLVTDTIDSIIVKYQVPSDDGDGYDVGNSILSQKIPK